MTLLGLRGLSSHGRCRLAVAAACAIALAMIAGCTGADLKFGNAAPIAELDVALQPKPDADQNDVVSLDISAFGLRRGVTLNVNLRRYQSISIVGGTYKVALDFATTGERLLHQNTLDQIAREIDAAMTATSDPAMLKQLAGDLAVVIRELDTGHAGGPSCEGKLQTGKKVTATVRWLASTSSPLGGDYVIACQTSTQSL